MTLPPSLRFGLRVAVKALLLFAALNLLWAAWNPPLGRISLYNTLLPGRQRFLPFGENFSQSYNLSLYDLDAMFASHAIAAGPKPADEYRVILIGDSSIWGTLLRPSETLSGQLNALQAACDSRRVQVYNLGYPTISLTKDVMLLRRALAYQPDVVIWGVTLEAMPVDKQIASPLAANNPADLAQIAPAMPSLRAVGLPPMPTFAQRTILGQRRALADLLRLQAAGFLWAATGVDQEYPASYKPAQLDYDPDPTFHTWPGPEFPPASLAWDALSAGADLVGQGGARLLLLNEPMLISSGKNSALRYNFFYPRWAYDRYRAQLADLSRQNGWPLLDAWDSIPAAEFTNSAIHLTPTGESALARLLAPRLCP